MLNTLFHFKNLENVTLVWHVHLSKWWMMCECIDMRHFIGRFIVCIGTIVLIFFLCALLFGERNWHWSNGDLILAELSLFYNFITNINNPSVDQENNTCPASLSTCVRVWLLLQSSRQLSYVSHSHPCLFPCCSWGLYQSKTRPLRWRGRWNGPSLCMASFQWHCESDDGDWKQWVRC